MNVDAKQHIECLKLLNKHETAHTHYRLKSDRLAKLCAVALGAVPCSHEFRFKDAKHFGEMRLPNGSTLIIGQTDKGWYLAGKTGEYSKGISFSNEAMDHIVSAVLKYRGDSPLPNVQFPENK